MEVEWGVSRERQENLRGKVREITNTMDTYKRHIKTYNFIRFLKCLNDFE